MGVMGIYNSWTQQHQRKKRSKSHRHRAQYVNLIAAPAGTAPEEEVQALGADLAEGDGLGRPMTFELFIFLLHWTDWLTYAAKTKIQMLLVKCRRLAT